ncbi:hypothetical protein TWF694_007774 [Orbilia ellipsospora]|uniref:Polyketide synthase n=1 Tax=Orbilia ellipsospora TaxID=2528407 RepID=A0AAV9XIT4_9PEZI
MKTADVDDMHRYSMPGFGNTMLANRISHVFNLNGPSLTLDTACSSGMYCLHLACVALETGDCDGAVVAAANLIQSVQQQIAVSKLGILSPTSTCHTFDASADGYGRADGVGALYLKRLSDAIRDGDPIRAVIRGTALNANGKTQGISLPSAEHQEKVIRKAYAKAGLDLNQTTYVECHGTGTPVGDPIEVDAVSRSFEGPSKGTLRIGSVKTNLGHSEATSAITSIIKVVLALENNFIPPSIGITNISPKINLSKIGVEIVTKGQPWITLEDSASPLNALRRAGVNSFGYGGANGHAILENAQVHISNNYNTASEAKNENRATYILPLSASTKEGLNHRIKDLATYISLKSVSIQDLVYTLGCRRSHLQYRGYLLVRYTSLEKDILDSNLRMLPKESGQTPVEYAFVFTGQGAQWPQMGMELFEEFEIFRRAFADMNTVLRNLPHPPSWCLQSVIFESKAASQIMDPVYSQAACTAIQLGLVLLLRSWGIVPSAVVGHSSGEIASAFAAGFISLSEAITIAYYRGYLVNTVKSDGGMIAVGLSEKEANHLINTLGFAGKVLVACVNSPSSVTISGDNTEIDRLLAHLESKQIFARRLQTKGRAYHSHHMKGFGENYQSILESVLNTKSKFTDKSTELPPGAIWVSSVTGEILESRSCDPAYWRMNLESPVLFSQAVSRVTRLASYHLIEIGPHSALELPIRQIRSSLGIKESSLPYSPSIVRFQNAVTSILNLVGRLFLHKGNIPFDKVNGLIVVAKDDKANLPNYRVLHDLPNYRWTYADSPLWLEPRASFELRFRKYCRHELLGTLIPGGNGVEHSWKNILRLEETPWLKDHKLGESVVFPGAGYISMVIEAMRQVAGLTGKPHIHTTSNYSIRIQSMNILSALVLPMNPTSPIELFTTVRQTQLSHTTNSKEWMNFTIVSVYKGTSTTHVTGIVKVNGDIRRPQARLATSQYDLESTAPRAWYEKFGTEGLEFGPEFRTVTSFAVPAVQNLRYCAAVLPLKQQIGVEKYPIHPVTIDALFQASIVAAAAGNIQDLDAKVPTRIGSILFLFTPQTIGNEVGGCLISSDITQVGFGFAVGSAKLVTPTNNLIAHFENIRLAPYIGGRLGKKGKARYPISRVLWKPDPSPGLMADEDLNLYLKPTSSENNSLIPKIMAIADIMGHKNPFLRILELGPGTFGIAKAIMDTLSSKSAFPRLFSYSVGIFGEDKDLRVSEIDLMSEAVSAAETVSDKKFDLIILPEYQSTALYLTQNLTEIRSLLSSSGNILVRTLPHICDSIDFKGNGLAALKAEDLASNTQWMMIHRMAENETINISFNSSSILIVERSSTSFGTFISEAIYRVTAKKPTRISIEDISIETCGLESTVISLLEIDNPLLAASSVEEWDRVKILIERATCLFWITNGNLLDCTAPDYSLIYGLSRAAMMEQPSLKFFVYDVDSITRNPEKTCKNIGSILQNGHPNTQDFEFIERRGIVHISRFVPDDVLNTAFRQSQGLHPVDAPFGKVGAIELSMKTPGQFDSIYFKQIKLSELAPIEVRVSLRYANINARDFGVLSGQLDPEKGHSLHEFSGVVEEVGSEVTKFLPGDHVYVMAPCRFRTVEIIPQWACYKLSEDEIFDIGTAIYAYATAIYALHNKAGLEAGESVLIHSGAGGVGIAAIQIAQSVGAEIFTTVSSLEQKEFLVSLGVNPENIFSSEDSSFEAVLMGAVGGKGVDVVINSLSGDLLHASWRCCGSFGRFVDLSKKDSFDSGKLAMDQFVGNMTYTALDLSEVYHSTNPKHQRAWTNLIAEAFRLCRSARFDSSIPLEVFGIQELPRALKKFGSRSRIGRIGVSLEDPSAILSIEPARYQTEFDSQKTYLMIGCLGGLGRSLTKWMIERGAKKFVFLGRSGLAKESARRLVRNLTEMGASCKVIKGDVCSMDDVGRMVEAAESPIGGVIQAAMGLSHKLVNQMSNDCWHTAIDPKVSGTWNIHNRIRGKDNQLDFFLLISSTAGTIESAADGNYAAANQFLDNFASMSVSYHEF